MRNGLALYHDGKLEEAQRALEKAVTHEPILKRDELLYQEAADTLANIYWETGQDGKLLTFAEEHLSGWHAHGWTCFVEERYQLWHNAELCWRSFADEMRARRIQRERGIAETLETPPTPAPQ